MAANWYNTQLTGVRYREHNIRKHNGRKDRYFTIRYKINGKLKEEGLGWASEGWNVQKASLLRSELRNNQKTGAGPHTLSDKRALTQEHEEANKHRKKLLAKQNVSLGEFFRKEYFPHAKSTTTLQSYRREESLFRIWIAPVIGHLSFREVPLSNLEQIKSNMLKAGRSPRTVNYAIHVVRRIFNHAKHNDVYNGPSVVEKCSMIKFDNKRRRFLDYKEVKLLLSELKKRSPQLFEIALLGLRTGARANEIFSLKWGDVDFERGILTLWDTKSSKTRVTFMTEDIKLLLKSKTHRGTDRLIFPGRNGSKIKNISNAFDRAVKVVGLNEGVKDRRMRVVFHTLRHTYASWLVERGEDLYTVKELLGHSTITMTERYSHLGENTLQNAVRSLEAYNLTSDESE